MTTRFLPHTSSTSPEAGETRHGPEPVWGVPSDEMLQSERDGDIILVEDFDEASRRAPNHRAD